MLKKGLDEMTLIPRQSKVLVNYSLCVAAVG